MEHVLDCPQRRSRFVHCICPKKVLDFSTKTEVELLQMTLPYLDQTEDEGPHGEGWKSDSLETLIKEIQSRIK